MMAKQVSGEAFFDFFIFFYKKLLTNEYDGSIIYYDK